MDKRELFTGKSNSFPCQPMSNEIYDDFEFISTQYGKIKITLCRQCGSSFAEQTMEDSVLRGEHLADIQEINPEFFLILLKAIYEHSRNKPAANPQSLETLRIRVLELEQELTRSVL